MDPGRLGIHSGVLVGVIVGVPLPVFGTDGRESADRTLSSVLTTSWMSVGAASSLGGLGGNRDAEPLGDPLDLLINLLAEQESTRMVALLELRSALALP